MKLIKKVIIITMFLLIITINKTYGSTGIVKVSATRLRKEPNTTSEIITNIYEDDEIEIIGEEGEWYKVTFKSNTGFVKKEFIKVSANSQNGNTTSGTNINSNEVNTNTNVNSNTSENTNNTSNIDNSSVSNNTDVSSVNTDNTDNVNISTVIPERVTLPTNNSLRMLPSFMSRVISNAEQGKEFDKVNELNEWIQITDGTIIGWIPKAKLNLNNDNSNAIVENQNIENTVSDNASVEKTDTDTNKDENKTETSNKTSENTAKDNTNTTLNDNSNQTTNQTTNESSNDSFPKTGKINVETARVREGASATAEIIDGLDYGKTVDILSESGDWYKIKTGDIEGYVSKRLITLTGNTTSRSLTESRANEEQEDNSQIDAKQNNDVNTILQNGTASVDSGNNVVNFAKQYLGYPYVSAGKSPDTGFDCSGFTRYVFMQFGVTLGGSAASQAGSGAEVSRDALIPGDLLLFYDEGKTKIGHTGIYIGDGNFIHAANPSRGVVTDNLNTSSYYNTRFISARRIIN